MAKIEYIVSVIDKASRTFDDIADAGERLDLILGSVAEKTDRVSGTLGGQTEAAHAAAEALNKLRDSAITAAAAQDAMAEKTRRSGESLDGLTEKAAAATAATGAGSGGLSGVSGLGALIGAGVALSPILTAVAFGVGGFGLAAAGSVAPIVKAAEATGGLKANMSQLDPEQRRLAGSVLDLGKQYQTFSKSLEPEALTVFGKGIKLAGDLLHDVQPIAVATGKALGGMLGQIDDEFKSGTWRQFFGFMAATAGPDIKLLTTNFVNLADALPPVLEDLQPVATGLLNVTAAAVKFVGVVASAPGAVRDWGNAQKQAGGATGELNGQLARFVAFMLTPGLDFHFLAAPFDGMAGSMHGAALGAIALADGTTAVGSTAAASRQPVFSLATAVKGLTDAMAKNVGQVLTLQGDEVAWRQSLAAATKQLDSNSAGLGGNSAKALANKAAVLQATQNVVAFAGDQLKLGGNLNAASARIQDQIGWLQKHGDKSKFATQEIHALRVEEGKLRATIRQKLLVTASGFWTVTGATKGGGRQPGGPHPVAAAGRFITAGRPGVDDQLVLAQRHELIVPAPMVRAGAVDHLRGKIPGFAAGGVVGKYTGSVGGAPKWLAAEDTATLHAVAAATAAATAAGIKSAQAAASGGGFGGIGGGGSGTNVQIGKRMAASIGWTGNDWAFLDSGWQEESGWRTNAQNPLGTPYTAAYGIPQSNPGSKMAAAGPDWLTNPATQIKWGLGYIRGTYGSPTGVPLWSAHGPLPGYVGYDQGGLLKPGLTLAVNNTGKPEMVVPSGKLTASVPGLNQVRAGGASGLPMLIMGYGPNVSTMFKADVTKAIGPIPPIPAGGGGDPTQNPAPPKLTKGEVTFRQHYAAVNKQRQLEQAQDNQDRLNQANKRLLLQTEAHHGSKVLEEQLQNLIKVGETRAKKLGADAKAQSKIIDKKFANPLPALQKQLGIDVKAVAADKAAVKQAVKDHAPPELIAELRKLEAATAKTTDALKKRVAYDEKIKSPGKLITEKIGGKKKPKKPGFGSGWCGVPCW